MSTLAKARWSGLFHRAQDTAGRIGADIGANLAERAAASRLGRRLSEHEARDATVQAMFRHQRQNGWMRDGSEGVRFVYRVMAQRIRQRHAEMVAANTVARQERWGDKGAEIGERIGRAVLPAAGMAATGAAAVTAVRQLSQAQIEQRRAAARARWDNR